VLKKAYFSFSLFAQRKRNKRKGAFSKVFFSEAENQFYFAKLILRKKIPKRCFETSILPFFRVFELGLELTVKTSFQQQISNSLT